MSFTTRRNYIIRHLQEFEQIDIALVANELNVSSMTIRRDLHRLENQGILTMVHGGATLNIGAAIEYSTFYKNQEMRTAKQSIARECLKFIQEGETIFLDSGTTTKEIAELILFRKNISMLTHSLLVANTLSKNARSSLIMCPGEFREHSMAFMGPLTQDFIKHFKIDTLFLAVEGLDINHGVTVPDITDGTTKKALIEQASTVVCVCDSTKFNKAFFYKIADITNIDYIITDDSLDSNTVTRFNDVGIKIIVASSIKKQR